MSLASCAKFMSLVKSTKFASSRKPGLAAQLSSGSDKIVLCIACFAYSIVVVVVVVFPVFSY